MNDSATKAWICPKCQDKFSSRGQLVSHLSVGRRCGSRSTRLDCPRCPARFPHAATLMHHLTKPTACRRFREELRKRVEALALAHGSACASCGAEQGSGRALLQHLHARPDCLRMTHCDQLGCQRCGARAPYTCPDCGAEFGILARLRGHVLSPVACDIRRRRDETLRLLARAREEDAGSRDPPPQAPRSRVTQSRGGECDGSLRGVPATQPPAPPALARSAAKARP